MAPLCSYLALFLVSTALPLAASRHKPSMVVSPVFFERWGYNGTPRLSDEVGGVHFGGAWYGNFTVGNATDVVLMLGTGSDDLVLKPGVYKPSPASEPHGPQCELKYGDLLPNSTGNSADFNASIYEDVVGLGDVVAKHHIIDVQIGNVRGLPWWGDGLVGLGFDSLGLVFWTNGHGQMVVGGALPGYEKKLSITAANLERSPTQNWNFRGDVYAGETLIASDVHFLLDTGNPVSSGPMDDVRKLFQALNMTEVCDKKGNPWATYPCDHPPKIGFGFPSKSDAATFALSHDNPVSPGPVSNHTSVFTILPDPLIAASVGFGPNRCRASITELKTMEPWGWMLGQNFFQGHYVDFNYGPDDGKEQFLGFAQYDNVKQDADD